MAVWWADYGRLDVCGECTWWGSLATAEGSSWCGEVVLRQEQGLPRAGHLAPLEAVGQLGRCSLRPHVCVEAKSTGSAGWCIMVQGILQGCVLIFMVLSACPCSLCCGWRSLPPFPPHCLRTPAAGKDIPKGFVKAGCCWRSVVAERSTEGSTSTDAEQGSTHQFGAPRSTC